MDFEKRKVNNYFLYDTEVENLFVGEYMLDAPGDYVKVYLLALMYAKIGEPVDNTVLAKQLTLSEESIDKAWDYWESMHLVKKLAKKEGSDAYRISFVNLKEAVFGKCAIEFVDNAKFAKAELDLSDVNLAVLYQDIEKVTGRLLEGKETEIVASWITDFGIRPEVILYCYKYSTENGKSNRVKYVEKILFDWREKNLDSVDLIEEYLGESDRAFKLYKRVFKALGFEGRNPSEPEKAIMRKWFFEKNLSIDDVLAAIAKTTGSNNPNIKYVDAILSDKDKLGIEKTASENAYSKIAALYEKLREDNAKKSEEIRLKVYKQLPRVEEIVKQQKQLSMQLVNAMLAKNVALQKEIETAQTKLLKEKEQLLNENGFSKNALDPIYSCNKCKDTGFLDDGSTCSCYADKLEFYLNGR